jgi:hypothetical protein
MSVQLTARAEKRDACPNRCLGMCSAEEPEIRACSRAARGQMHYGGMSNIAVGKHRDVHVIPLDHFFWIAFFHDGNPISDIHAQLIREDNGGRQCLEFA